MRQEIIETDEKRNDLESYILTMRDPVLTANIVPFVRLACFVQGSERTSPDHVFLLLFFRDTFSTAHHVVPMFFVLRSKCSQNCCNGLAPGQVQ